MSEPIFLQMPAPGLKKRGRLLLRLLPLWALAGLLACVWWWMAAGRVSSSWAMLDGMVYAVSSEFPARVEALNVREGENVARGQVLVRLDAREYARHAAEAQREAALLRAVPGPPSIEESAARLKQAQDAEQDMVSRMAIARHAEERKRKEREERVAEHVRAQLALRSLDSQGGEHAVGRARYAAARQAEARARAAKESAEADFEQTSLVRAAMDQELARVREETLRYKQMASRNRYARPQYVADALRTAAAAPQAAVDGNIYAPQQGRILRNLVAPGQTVRKGEPMLLLLPQGGEAQKTFWLLAYFTPDAAEALKPEQPCAITLNSGEVLTGRVFDKLEPQPLPAAAQAAMAGEKETGAAPALFVPVRVTLGSDANGKQLAPGMEGACVVKTRTLWN